MAQPLNRWTPIEVRKLISLVSGIILIILGIILLTYQTKADGIVDFKFGVITGNIKSTSAGLFISLFGLILIAISFVASNNSNTPPSYSFDITKGLKHIGLMLTFILLLTLIIVYIYNPNTSLIALMIILAIPFMRIVDLK
jgi:hypothetical protein